MRSRHRVPRGVRTRFEAPLSRTAWGVGLGVMLLLAGSLGVVFLTIPASERWVVWLVAPTHLLIALGIGLTAVRGYELRGDELWVRRLIGHTRISLAQLESAVVDPQALKGAWRTIGNGGCFGWTGWFRSKRLGSFRALVTDPARAVVLQMGDRCWVVSPDDPPALVRALGLEPETSSRKV